MACPRRTTTSRSTGDYRHDAARQLHPGEHRRRAAKVIDQRRDEVMRVVGV